MHGPVFIPYELSCNVMAQLLGISCHSSAFTASDIGQLMSGTNTTLSSFSSASVVIVSLNQFQNQHSFIVITQLKNE